MDGQDNVAIQRRLGEPKKGENKQQVGQFMYLATSLCTARVEVGSL